MANDDLSGVVVGMKVMEELRKRRDLRYTYRYLIVPETIGSIAYLDRYKELVPTMIGGLFLEMLGLENPPTLQLSFAANTPLDRSFTQALKAHDYHGWTGKFRTVIGNDERQFNGPGMRVPMLSVSRVLPSAASDWPYREYHSDHDNLELCKLSRLEDSVKLVLRTIDTLERDVTPVNRFNGEIFCSRYGVFVDPYANPEGHQKLFDIMDHIDGTRSISQIAEACGTPFDAVWHVAEELRRHGVVEYR
jgi:aminopeptidase-like protein